MLRGRITEDEAAEALDRLFDMEFLRRGPDGSVEVREVTFRSDPETDQLAVQHFHRTQVPELIRRLREDDPSERHLSTMTLPLSPDLVPEFKARVDAFVAQMANLADAAPREPGARIYQLSVQLLPLTEPALGDGE